MTSSYEEWLGRNIPRGWVIADHIRQICRALDAVRRGEIDRLLITMPPRHAKSETVTVRYPLYWLEADPVDNVLVTGYNERFAIQLGRKTRNMAFARGLVAEDKSAASEWATTSGGLYMARGVGSPPTGTGFGLICIDDPIRRRADAESETYREALWDWYTDDLYTRLEPGGAIVLTMTLWHHDDLGARVVASEPNRWHILRQPAISDQGKALWPDRFDLPALERAKATIGDYAFESLYQCNPTPREGALFKVSMIRVVDAIPAGARHVQALDLAATDNDGDYTAILDLYEKDGRYTVDVTRFQCEPDERNRRIRQRADLKQPRTIRIPQDPGAAGKESAKAMIRLLAGHTVKALPVSGDKVLRADPAASQVNAGNVDVLKSEFAGAFIEELRQFPNGKHDDMVDALSDAFAELTQYIPLGGGSFSR